MRITLLGVLFFLFFFASPAKSNILSNSHVLEVFKDVKVYSFKIKADAQTIRDAFLKDEDILHVYIEEFVVVLYTETNVTDAAIRTKLDNALGTGHVFISSTIGDRNPRLFKK